MAQRQEGGDELKLILAVIAIAVLLAVAAASLSEYRHTAVPAPTPLSGYKTHDAPNCPLVWQPVVSSDKVCR